MKSKVWGFNLVVLALPIILLIVNYAFNFFGGDDFKFNFSSALESRQLPLVQGQIASASILDNALYLKTKANNKPLFLLKPRAESSILLRKKWGDIPYITINLASQTRPQTLYLFWLFSNDTYFRYPVKIKSGAQKIIIDVRHDIVWERVKGFETDQVINNIGLNWQSDVHMRDLSFSATLPPLEALQLFSRKLLQSPPISVSGINFYYSRNIGGESVNYIFGLLLCYYTVYFLWYRNRQSIKVVAIIGLSLILINEFAYFRALTHYAGAGYKKSQLFDDRSEQMVSRFSREFMQLDTQLQKIPPKSSRVLFPFPDYNHYYVQGEINWLWFLYYGEYWNKVDRSRNSFLDSSYEYVFYYYPLNMTLKRSESATNALDNTKAKWKLVDKRSTKDLSQGAVKELPVEIVYKVSKSVYLLKIL